MQLNREKLADALGCSLRTIDEHVRQGMPGDKPTRPGSQWRFELSRVIDWLRDRERQSALGEIAQIDEAEARKRKLAAEARMAERNDARDAGVVVAIADFQTAWSQMIGAARARLLGLGSGLGPMTALSSDPSECAALIDAGVAEALQELSEFEPELSVEPERDSEPQADVREPVKTVGTTSGPDGKRVGGHRKTPQPRKQRDSG